MWELSLDSCHQEIRGMPGLALCKTDFSPCVLKAQVSDRHSRIVRVRSQEEYPVVAVLSGGEITRYMATEAPDLVTG